MKTKIYNIKAENIGEITLPKSVFEAKVSETLISQVIRSILASKRSAYAKTKTRSEVVGTRQKVWAQKGTGRARHGNRTSPTFVGGGRAWGPAGEQNYSINLNKKTRRAAINSVLSKFAQEKRIIVVDQLNSINPKTKEAIKLITGLKANNEVLSKSSKVGIITTKTLDNVKRAFGNLKNSNLLSLKSINAYDLANQNFLILTKKAVKQFEK